MCAKATIPIVGPYQPVDPAGRKRLVEYGLGDGEVERTPAVFFLGVRQLGNQRTRVRIGTAGGPRFSRCLADVLR